MTRIPWLATFYAATLHVLAADTVVARDIDSLERSGLIFSTSEVITQTTTVTDHTTSIETDVVTLTQTAYVITTPLEETVTQTVTEAEGAGSGQAEETDAYATAVPTEAYPSGVTFEEGFPTAEATYTVEYTVEPTEAFPTADAAFSLADTDDSEPTAEATPKPTAVPTEAFPSGVSFGDFLTAEITSPPAAELTVQQTEVLPTAEANLSPTVEPTAQTTEAEFIALPSQALSSAIYSAAKSVTYQEEPTQAFPTPETPHATLQPAVYFNVPLDDLANLIPTDNHDLYYTQDGIADPNVEHSYALLNANLSAPAVTLEHSIYIESIICQALGLLVTFTTKEAYEIAEITWPIAKSFILITHTYGCAPVSVNDTTTRTFFSVSNATFSAFDSLSATLIATQIALEDALTEVDLSWGTYTPNDNNTLPTPAASFGTPLATPLETSYYSTYAAPSQSPTLGVFKEQTPASTSCGPLPAATISGLPAAPCGSGFDAAIDKALGYVSFSDGSFSSTLQNIAPGLDDYNLADYQQAVAAPQARGLEKRFFNPIKALKKFAQKAVAVIQSVPAAVKTAVNQGVAAAKQGIQAVAEAVNNLFNPAIDAPFNVNLGPKTLVDSPFGKAFKIFKKEKETKNGKASGEIGLYCVNCGVTGAVRVQGKISFSFIQAKITSGNLGINGNLKLGLGLGLAAETTYENTITQPIVSVGVPGFSIPNIVTIGPVLALDVDLVVKIQASGEVLVGADASLPNFAANLDLVDKTKSTQSGFEPKFETYFNVSGEITASANLGVPMTVGVGIDLVPLKIRKLIAVKNRPGIEATAQYAYSNYNPGDCNNGISYGIALTNDAILDFFGLATKDLVRYRKPVVTKCHSFGKKKGTVKRRLRFERQVGTPTVIPTATPLKAADDNKPSSSTFVNLEKLAAQNEDLISQSKNNTNGLNYTMAVDSTGVYNLAAGHDGNFRVQNTNVKALDGNVLFSASDNVIVSDQAERFIFYYPATMEQFGVSRIRLSDTAHFPKSADIISLVPLNSDNSAKTPGVFVAVGTSKVYLYPVICNIENQTSKIFLVNDVQKGLEKLTDPALRFIVTGGVVNDCKYIAFLAGTNGF